VLFERERERERARNLLRAQFRKGARDNMQMPATSRFAKCSRYCGNLLSVKRRVHVNTRVFVKRTSRAITRARAHARAREREDKWIDSRIAAANATQKWISFSFPFFFLLPPLPPVPFFSSPYGVCEIDLIFYDVSTHFATLRSSGSRISLRYFFVFTRLL